LIGRGCKDRKVLSLPVLIGRGLEGTASGVAVWSLHRGSESQAKVPLPLGTGIRTHEPWLNVGDHIVPLDRFPVALPEGPHPFPFRTRSLSPPGPMVLCGQLRGRVGRCRDYFRRSESSCDSLRLPLLFGSAVAFVCLPAGSPLSRDGIVTAACRPVRRM
jgi:hypothetical protein